MTINFCKSGVKAEDVSPQIADQELVVFIGNRTEAYSLHKELKQLIGVDVAIQIVIDKSRHTEEFEFPVLFSNKIFDDPLMNFDELQRKVLQAARLWETQVPPLRNSFHI